MRIFGSLLGLPRSPGHAVGAPLARLVNASALVLALSGLAGFAPLAGCAVTSRSTVEQRPDGSYKLSCRDPLPRCLQRAEDICMGTRYVVVRAVDHHDYVGSQSTVGEAQLRSSEALFRCGKRGKSWWGPEADPMSMPDPVAATAATPPPPVQTRACVPGATQQCAGPAACRGGQSCLTDGSGYTPCDCGGSSPSADAEAREPGSTATPNAPAPPVSLPSSTTTPARGSAAGSASPGPSTTPVPRW